MHVIVEMYTSCGFGHWVSEIAGSEACSRATHLARVVDIIIIHV